MGPPDGAGALKQKPLVFTPPRGAPDGAKPGGITEQKDGFTYTLTKDQKRIPTDAHFFDFARDCYKRDPKLSDAELKALCAPGGELHAAYTQWKKGSGQVKFPQQISIASDRFDAEGPAPSAVKPAADPKAPLPPPGSNKGEVKGGDKANLPLPELFSTFQEFAKGMISDGELARIKSVFDRYCDYRAILAADPNKNQAALDALDAAFEPLRSKNLVGLDTDAKRLADNVKTLDDAVPKSGAATSGAKSEDQITVTLDPQDRKMVEEKIKDVENRLVVPGREKVLTAARNVLEGTTTLGELKALKGELARLKTWAVGQDDEDLGAAIKKIDEYIAKGQGSKGNAPAPAPSAPPAAPTNQPPAAVTTPPAPAAPAAAPNAVAAPPSTPKPDLTNPTKVPTLKDALTELGYPGDVKEALKLFQKNHPRTAKLDVKALQKYVLATATFKRGTALIEAKDFAQAKAVLEKSNALRESPNTILYIARCQRELGDPKAAAASYDRAMKLAGDDPYYAVTKETALKEKTLLNPTAIPTAAPASGVAAKPAADPNAREHLDKLIKGYLGWANDRKNRRTWSVAGSPNPNEQRFIADLRAEANRLLAEGGTLAEMEKKLEDFARRRFMALTIDLGKETSPEQPET